MDYETARKFLKTQINTSDLQADTFLNRLRQRKNPIPGQATNILLALKMIFEHLQGEPILDRELVYTLYLLAYESRQYFEAGRKAGMEWSFLLNEDINRIGKAVKSIFMGVWEQ